MKTIDAGALIAKKLANDLARYPKGALTIREMLIALPGGEAEFARVDAALTKVIWEAAAQGEQASADDLIFAAKHAMSLKEEKQLLPTFKQFLKQASA